MALTRPMAALLATFLAPSSCGTMESQRQVCLCQKNSNVVYLPLQIRSLLQLCTKKRTEW